GFGPTHTYRCVVAALATVLVTCSATIRVLAADYPVTGMVVKVDRVHKTFTASVQEIPNYMPAMTMPFEVREARELDVLAPGIVVSFTLHVDKKTSWASAVR